MRGVILAGGSGSRLFPLTAVTSKQLLPVFDKPMIHYPLAALMLAGLRDFVMITTEKHRGAYQSLLRDGRQWGISIEYRIQSEPRGIAEAVSIGADAFSDSGAVLVLGDNLFYGAGFSEDLLSTYVPGTAQVFGYRVANPRDYAVAELDEDGTVMDIVEKPLIPRSDVAVPGIYVLPQDAPDLVQSLQPSPRGELEITDLNRMYLAQGRLVLKQLSRGTAWLDTGTFAGLHDASTFVRVVQERQGTRVACLEEIAFRRGFIDEDGLEACALEATDDLRQYLSRMLLNP